MAPSARISRTGFWCGPAWWVFHGQLLGHLEGAQNFLGVFPKIPAWEHLKFFPMDIILYIYIYIYIYVIYPIYTYTQTPSFNISDCGLPPCCEATFSGVFWSSQVAWYGKKVCGHDWRSPDLGGVRGCVHRSGQHFRDLSCIVCRRTYRTFFPNIIHRLSIDYP